MEIKVFFCFFFTWVHVSQFNAGEESNGGFTFCHIFQLAANFSTLHQFCFCVVSGVCMRAYVCMLIESINRIWLKMKEKSLFEFLLQIRTIKTRHDRLKLHIYCWVSSLALRTYQMHTSYRLNPSTLSLNSVTLPVGEKDRLPHTKTEINVNKI